MTSQESDKKVHARTISGSAFKSAERFITFFLLLLYLLILVLTAEVGLAQTQSSSLNSRLDKARRLAYHTRFLREVAKSSPMIEVTWNMEVVFPSLRYIAENGSDMDNNAARAVASIFNRTEDFQARILCLSALKRIGNKVAKKELLRIFNDNTVAAEFRSSSAEYLQIEPSQRSKPVGTSAGSQLNVTDRP